MVKKGDKVKILILRQSIGEDFTPGSVLSLVVELVNTRGFMAKGGDVVYVAPYFSHKIFWEIARPKQMVNK